MVEVNETSLPLRIQSRSQQGRGRYSPWWVIPETGGAEMMRRLLLPEIENEAIIERSAKGQATLQWRIHPDDAVVWMAARRAALTAPSDG